MAEWEGFDVEGRLGAGTTGTVWLARQLSVGRQVALKELAPELAGDPAVRDRLRHEAQLLARLEHPNCVEVYAYLESSSAAAIVMEYVEGVSLRTLVEGGPLSVEQTLGVLEGSLDALAYAHGQGIVHGDLKPENILLATSGESKLVDFGLAAAVGTRRAPGTGSPTYSSPEAAAGEPLDASSDLYSAGLVLYELLTGAIPAGGGAAIAGGAATDALPAPVAALVQHALDPDPAARPQSATAFLEDLRTAAEAGCGSDWRRRAVIAPLVVAAASGAASALGAVKAGAATPGPAHSGAVAARRGSRVGHALHAHPWAAAALAGVVVVAGGAIGVGASRSNSSPSSPAPTVKAAVAHLAPVTRCPDATTLLGVLRPDLPTGASVTAIDQISCWDTWVVATPVGNGNGWVVYSTRPNLHDVTSSAEEAAFRTQVCGSTTSPVRWRTSPDIADCASAATTNTSAPTTTTSTPNTTGASSLNGTYTISLPPGDDACGSPSLSGETLTVTGTSAAITPVGGGTAFTGTAATTGSTFTVHVTNGITDAPGAIVVDLSGSIEPGGDLSGQSQNSGIYPGGATGFGCNSAFTATRVAGTGSPAGTAAAPPSTANGPGSETAATAAAAQWYAQGTNSCAAHPPGQAPPVSPTTIPASSIPVTWSQFTPDQSGSGQAGDGATGGPGPFTATFQNGTWSFTPLFNFC